jgi:hypothetical protein
MSQTVDEADLDSRHKTSFDQWQRAGVKHLLKPSRSFRT